MRKRRCAAKNKRGEPCGFAPLRDSELCWAHDPENEGAAQEARRHGGLRRKRENTLAGAYDFDGINSDGALARLLDIAAYDALSLDLSVAKVRAVVAIVKTGVEVLVAQDHEERIAAMESVMQPKLKKGFMR